jgi:sarcosine oxidase delta subunit
VALIPSPTTPSSSPRPGPRSVNEFLSSLEALNRHATQVEKLPRKRLLEQLSTFGNPQAEAKSLLRHINGLTRRFEQIRQTLQDEQVDRVASAAQHRGTQHLQQMVDQQALLEPTEFAQRLDWTRQALSKALGARRVFFVDLRGARYYPAFFDGRQVRTQAPRSGVEGSGRSSRNGQTAVHVDAQGSLAKLTPLEALAEGKVDAVTAAAEAFAQG